MFRNCKSLKEVHIGSNVAEIGDNAFNGCSNIQTLTCTAVTPPICGNDVFDGVDKQDCDLLVPSESIEEYKSTRQWRDFLWIKGGAENSIEEVIAPINNPDADYYDLWGRRVSKPTRPGIYIVNGKKIRV